MTRLLLLVVVTVTLMTGLATTAQAVDIPTVSYKLLHPTPKAMRILELLSAMEVEDKDKGFKYIGAVATCKRTGLARNKTGLGWRHLTCAVKKAGRPREACDRPYASTHSCDLAPAGARRYAPRRRVPRPRRPLRSRATRTSTEASSSLPPGGWSSWRRLAQS